MAFKSPGSIEIRYFETRYIFKDQHQGVCYKRDVGYGQGDEKFREYFEKSQGKRRKEDVAVVRNIIRKYNFLHKRTIKGVKWIESR